MDKSAKYSAAVSMHNHYSNVRAAIISFAAPVQLTMLGLAINEKSDYVFAFTMLIFATIFFVSIYLIWAFFTLKLNTVKSFLLRCERSSEETYQLFDVIYSRRTSDSGVPRFGLLPREFMDVLILIYGLLTIGIGFAAVLENFSSFLIIP